ncbi:MAG: hypothetical protein JWL69_4695 [Phycisphaerales bacterium]|nr:hypothetical protein [Phycisphaerales bacterium]MDB5354653.1 hypothetical protein [Phycisphaerales bacterium]
MIVYVGKSHKSIVQGSALKDVTCEHCGNVYHYEYRCIAARETHSHYGINEAGARRRGIEGASRAVDRGLRSGIAPVACPECKRIQADMVVDLKRRCRRQWQGLGYVLPGLLSALWAGIYLVESNFLDDPLPTQAKVVLTVTGIAVAGCFLAFGARSWKESMALNDSDFGKMKVRLGYPGPAPVAKTLSDASAAKPDASSM